MVNPKNYSIIFGSTNWTTHLSHDVKMSYLRSVHNIIRIKRDNNVIIGVNSFFFLLFFEENGPEWIKIIEIHNNVVIINNIEEDFWNK